MSGNHGRAYFCEVVSESVSVRIKTRQVGGFNGHSKTVAQCDQELCQYVDENEPPCPLHAEMFVEADRAAAAAAQPEPPAPRTDVVPSRGRFSYDW